MQWWRSAGKQDASRRITLAKKRIGGAAQRLRKRSAMSVQQLEADITVDPAGGARTVAHLEAVADVSRRGAGPEQGDLELARVAPLRSDWNRSESIGRR